MAGTSVIGRIALSQLRHHPGRIVGVLIAVMVSVGYLAGTLTFIATETGAIAQAATARTSVADVVVSDVGDELEVEPVQAAAGQLADVQGIGSAEISYLGSALLNDRWPIQLQSLPTDQQLVWADLESGGWPVDDHQIAVSHTTAEQNDLQLGDTVTIAEQGPELTVTGITAEHDTLMSGNAQTGFVTAGLIKDQPLPSADVLIIGDGTLTETELAARVGQVVGDDVTVATADAFAQQQIQGLTNGADIFLYLLLIFGAIAMLVGTILIINTFLILIVQRRQQIGLLRTVGATSGQVRRGLLLEATLIGAGGSLAGIALGIGLGAIGAAVSGSLSAGLVVPATVVIAAATGLIITVLAGTVPARRAARIRPLEALRPVAGQATARRASVAVAIVAGLLVAVGGGIIGYALINKVLPLPLTIAGSMFVAGGVLAGARLYAPPLLRVAGAVLGFLGPVSRLATENVRRNPGRAAATSASLMLAVGLIVTLQVGAASVRESTTLALADHYPVDITLTDTTGTPVGDDVINAVGAIDGIVGVTRLQSAPMTIRVDDDRLELDVLSGPEAAEVINTATPVLDDQTLLIDPFLAESFGLRAGGQVMVRSGDHRAELTVQPSSVAADGIAVVGPGVFAELAPDAPADVLWAKADPEADPAAVNSGMTDIVEDRPDLTVGGLLSLKATYVALLDALLAIATALLGVAVLIALIGIGNTLGLSVIERARESALLRALGLTRRQLQLMIMVEAVLLALVGAAVGIASGALFGWIGTAALGLSTDLEFPRVVFAMSVPQTVAVVAIAVVAAVIASILPGRRAASAPPVAALADG